MAIICQGKELEQVETFKCLGSIITENGDCSKEIQARLGAATGAVRSLDSLWKDRSLNVKVKQRLLSTLVWTVALYGCETWRLKAVDVRRIQGFEGVGQHIRPTHLCCKKYNLRSDYWQLCRT